MALLLVLTEQPLDVFEIQHVVLLFLLLNSVVLIPPLGVWRSMSVRSLKKKKSFTESIMVWLIIM